MDGDTFEEETTQGWGSRLGDSIQNVVVGVLFVFVGIGLLFWNEGKYVGTKRALNEGLAAVVTLPDVTTVDPDFQNKLVHVTGTPEAHSNVTDASFGVNLDGPIKLLREVSMYQWVQHERRTTHKKSNGKTTTKVTYTYNKEWRNGPVSSGNFRRSGYNNPPMPFLEMEDVAKPVTLGAFTLADAVIEEIDFFEDLDEGYSVDKIPTSTKDMAGGKTVRLYSHDGYYFGSNPSSPQLGDLRVTLDIVPAEPMSIVAMQFHDTFTTYTAKNGRPILLVADGIVPATTMFEQAQSEAWYFVMALRLIGLVVIWAALQCILEPISVFADIIPLLGDFVEGVSAVVTFFIALGISIFVIAIAWLFYRPLFSVPLLVVIIGGASYYVYSKKKPTNTEPVEGTEEEILVGSMT